MSKFYYNVYQQRITVTPPCGLVGDSINYLSADFIFSEEWDGLYKVCYFAEKPEENVPYQVPLQDDTIRADMHLNLWAGTWYTWVSGDKTENGEVVQRITTNVVEFTVDKSGVIGGVPFEVAPSVQEDVLAKAEEALNKANDLEQRADSGEFQGKPGAAAGFGNVSASVDANTGTPSVEVRTSGTNEALNINFAFHNLKGESGGGGGGAVDSVNGKTGKVVLTAGDVGALAKDADIDMKQHNIHNVGEVDLTHLSIGATIGSTTNARLTGTSDGKAAFVRDNTQSTLVPVQVGAATQANEAVQRGQVASLAPVQSVNGATGAIKGTYYVQFSGTTTNPSTSSTPDEIIAAIQAGYAVQSVASFTDFFYGLPVYGQLFGGLSGGLTGTGILFGGICTPNFASETRSLAMSIVYSENTWKTIVRAIYSQPLNVINLLDYGAADGTRISHSTGLITAGTNYVTIGGRDWIDTAIYGYTTSAHITVSQASNVVSNGGAVGCVCQIIDTDGVTSQIYIDPGETAAGTFVMTEDKTGFTLAVKRPSVVKLRFCVGGNAGLIKADMTLE